MVGQVDDTTTRDKHQITSWILTEGRKSDGLGPLLKHLCAQLREVGVPIDRATLGVPILHPIAQSTFCLWDRDDGLTVNSLVWDQTNVARMQNSPIHAVYTEARGTDWWLDSDEAVARFSVGPDLRKAGFTHYLAIALPFSDGSQKALTIQTKQEEGFSDSNKDMINTLVPAISTVVEHHVQQGLTATLVNTFVGLRAGQRILDGNVHRGDGELIDAVIWMSDLRGFTQYAASNDTPELLDALNTYFETVTDAIYAHGGEVLKFIGDGVLGIFPIETGSACAVAQAEAAARQVMHARQGDNWPRGLSLGIGLHQGEVFFGNVGGVSRLDFTVIGAAVNLVSRIEELCSQTGHPVLASEAFRAASTGQYQSLGEWPLKGIANSVRVFAFDHEAD